MNFIDEINLIVSSGKGGDGVVRWNQTRRNQKGGPSGGNGGNGGDVIIRSVRDMALLGKYRGNTVFKADDGEAGGQASLYGHAGENIIINLPIGSVVTVTEETKDGKKNSKTVTEETKDEKENTFELLVEGEEQIILRGGRGGFGNEHFKSSRNVTPTESSEGKPGGKASLYVELRLIADLGLVGYPNVGKSSLLNALTNAKAKVGNYAFTTLDPNLGELYGYIIADIPGIIEGASDGKGLGHKFLRHISRTKALIYCVSSEQDDPISVYRALNNELLRHSSGFGEIPFMILLTKSDLVSDSEVLAKIKKLREITEEVQYVSILDDAVIKNTSDTLLQFVRAL